MNARKIFVTAAVLGMTLAAGAVPAKRDPYTVTQPDGTTLTIRKVGDETLHFTLTTDNKLVVRDASGQYSYARVTADGSIISSGVRALDPTVRPASHDMLTRSFDDIDYTALYERRVKAGTAHSLSPENARRLKAANATHAASTVKANASATVPPQSGMGRFTSSFPRTGDIRGLVILVEYQDVKFDTGYAVSAGDYFRNLVNQPGFSEYGGTGSAVDYFTEQSGGQFRPKFDVLGPVTLPNKMAYYGGNDSSGDDSRPHEMVIDACRLLDAEVDFKQYDNDGDGFVDNVFVFYAGQGEASYGSDDSVWPHAWEIHYGTGSYFTLDGVVIDRYACTNEWERSRPDGVGTFIHEFSHVMGLPDLYHTASSSAAYTPGAYSVMDYGPYNNNGRTPPVYSVYERNAMGWLIPEVLKEARTVSLGYIGDTNEGMLIQTPTETEFFLLENRQQKGWDQYIPGHGMMIWHVDYDKDIFDSNIVNNTRSHQYVDIVEANNNPNNANETAMAGWTWPGTAGKTEFTSATTPALKDWEDTAIDVPVTAIEEKDGIITFDVSGGVHLPTPEVRPVEDMGDDYFTAVWEAVPDATDYRVTVRSVIDGTSVTETADMGDDLTFPADWKGSQGIGSYTSNGNFGNAKPSLKFSATGHSLTTRVFDGDVKEISFWNKGMTTGSSGSMVIVEGLVPSVSGISPAVLADNVSGEWVKIADVVPVSNKSQTTVLNEIPAGVRAVRFTYQKSSGNLALDDITITAGGESVAVLPGYENVSTNGQTSLRVSPLDPATRHYRFTVTAVSGDLVSKPSSDRDVIVTPSAVEDIAIDATAERMTVSGRVLSVTTPAPRVDVFDTTGRLVASHKTTGGQATILLPHTGLYIVRAASAPRKLIARE